MCYHRVHCDSQDLWGNCVSPDNFRDQVKTLKRHYQVLSLDELLFILKDKIKFPSKGVVITFDDGYHSNLDSACSILADEKIPAIFFLNTIQLKDKRPFWWDSLQAIQLKALRDGAIKLSWSINRTQEEVRLQGEECINHFFRHAHKILKHFPREQRSQAIDQLVKYPIQVCPSMEPISEIGIRELGKERLFGIGGHSESHISLGLNEADTQRKEIADNLGVLSGFSSKPIRSFSYPFGGAEDYNTDTKAALLSSGIEASFTTKRMVIREEIGDKLEIPRFCIRDMTGEALMRKLHSYAKYN